MKNVEVTNEAVDALADAEALEAYEEENLY